MKELTLEDLNKITHTNNGREVHSLRINESHFYFPIVGSIRNYAPNGVDYCDYFGSWTMNGCFYRNIHETSLEDLDLSPLDNG